MRVIEYENLKWIDIVKPGEQEANFLERQFGFHPLIVEEVKTPTYHPLVESYGAYLFLILHFPNFNFDNQQIQNIEIDFLVTKDILVTVRYQDFSDFDAIFSTIENNPGQYLNKTTGHLFHAIVKRLFNKTFPELDRVKEAIDKTEEEIFKRFDEHIIEEIAYIKHEIIDFIRALKPQKSVWESSPEILLDFWGERLKPYISDLIADYNRTLHFAETHKEVVDSLHLTSSSLLDNKRNYVIKILTVFTAILLPLSLIASIYGMNLVHLPLANDPRAFWWFLWGMILITVGAVTWLKKNKWI